MTQYPLPLDKRFAAEMRDHKRRIHLLESRTASIDSGQPFAVLPAVVSGSYTSGDPQVYINGAAALSGPYPVLNDWTPTPNAPCLAMPVQGSYVILGQSTTPTPWQNLGAVATNWTMAGTARYRSLGNGLVVLEVVHLVPPPGGAADGAFVWSVANGLPAGFQPLITTARFAAYFAGSFNNMSPSLELQTNGSILVYGVSAVGGVNRLDVSMTFSTV